MEYSTETSGIVIMRGKPTIATRSRQIGTRSYKQTLFASRGPAQKKSLLVKTKFYAWHCGGSEQLCLFNAKKRHLLTAFQEAAPDEGAISGNSL